MRSNLINAKYGHLFVLSNMKTLAPDSLKGHSRDSTTDRAQYLMKITQNWIQYLAWDYLKRKKQKAYIVFLHLMSFFSFCI
jgi:hypothetical protein